MTTIQAIDLLKGLEQSLDDYCELNDEGKTAFRMGIIALELFGNAEQLSSVQPEQKWIPCSERLPDTNRDVLLQFGNSMGVGFWEHNSWGINTGDDIYSEIGEREAQPIAWRELPEPLRGEKHETD